MLEVVQHYWNPGSSSRVGTAFTAMGDLLLMNNRRGQDCVNFCARACSCASVCMCMSGGSGFSELKFTYHTIHPLQVCNSMVSNTVKEWYTDHYNQFLHTHFHVHHPKKGTPYPSDIIPSAQSHHRSMCEWVFVVVAVCFFDFCLRVF